MKAVEASMKAMEAKMVQLLENEAKVVQLLEGQDRTFKHTQEMAVRRVIKRDISRGWQGWLDTYTEQRRLENLKRDVVSRLTKPSVVAMFGKWRKDWEGEYLARAAAKLKAKVASQREESQAARAEAAANAAEATAATAEVAGATAAAADAAKKAQEVALRNATLSLEKERYIEHTADMAARRWLRSELKRAWLRWWLEWRGTWEADLARFQQGGPTIEDILARKVAAKLAELADIEESVEHRARHGELMSEAQLRFARKDMEVAVAWAKSATEYAEEEAQRADAAEARAEAAEGMLEGFDATEYTTKESFAIMKSTEAMERAAKAMAKAEAAEANAMQRTETAVAEAAKAEAAAAKAQADASKAKDLVKYLALKDAMRAIPAAAPSPRR